jgi:hypothetical protein
MDVMEGLAATYTDPNTNLPALLDDRPPFVGVPTLRPGGTWLPLVRLAPGPVPVTFTPRVLSGGF